MTDLGPPLFFWVMLGGMIAAFGVAIVAPCDGGLS
jgi:hypothetical protein